MKSRQSYFLISAIIIFSILTGIFIWRNKNIKQIPKFNEQSFNAPVSSKYIPANTDLVFHWKLNPGILPKYIESFQDEISKHAINKKISFIRDSSFQLIGFNFAKDISNWVGDYGSFAVFDSNKQTLNDWMMVLAIKEDINIEKELESILASKIASKSENDLGWIREGSKNLGFDKKNMNEAIDASLKRLKTDYIDLYQLHWPERNTNFFGRLGYEHSDDSEWTKFEDILENLKKFIDQGKIRHIGLSNETPWGVSKFLEISKNKKLPKMLSVQNPYNLLNRSYEVGLAEMSVREQIGL